MAFFVPLRYMYIHVWYMYYVPENVCELQHFLRLVKFYYHFILSYASLLHVPCLQCNVWGHVKCILLNSHYLHIPSQVSIMTSQVMLYIWVLGQCWSSMCPMAGNLWFSVTTNFDSKSRSSFDRELIAHYLPVCLFHFKLEGWIFC